MPLQAQTVPIVFAQGVDTKTDPKALESGRLTTLENGVFTAPGRIQKRNGYDALGRLIEASASSVTSAVGLVSFNDELLLASGARLYSYGAATGHWVDRGPYLPCAISSIPITHSAGTQSNMDSSVNAGVRVIAWEESGAIKYSVQDTSTGAFFVSEAQASAAASKPKVVAFGRELVLWYTNGLNLFYRRIAVATPTVLGAEINPIATLGTSGAFDVAAIGARLFIAWGDSAPSTRLAYFDSTYTLATPVTVGSNNAVAVSIWADVDQNAHVAMADTAGVYWRVYNYVLTPTVALATLETTANVKRVGGISPAGTSATSGAGSDYVYYELAPDATPSHNLVRSNSVTMAGVVGTAADFKRSVGLAAKPFQVSGARYVPTSYQSTLQSTYFVLDASANVIAKVHPHTGGPLRSDPTLAESVTLGSIVEFATGQQTRLVSASGNLFAYVGVSMGRVDFSATSVFAAKINNNFLLSGGIVSAYDGAHLSEAGFHLFPELTTANFTQNVGGGAVSGTVQYSIVYEWTDAFGQLVRSAPSPAITQVIASASSVTITIPTLRITAKSNVRIAVYRTQDSQTIPYRISSLSSPTSNSTTADSVTYTDTIADSGIAGNEILYTFGSILENDPPPAATQVATWKTRAVGFGGENPNQVFVSLLTSPFDAVNFDDALYVQCDPRGGAITALGVLDDKLVIFKRSEIFVMDGDGPLNTGQGGTFSTPSLIASDVGCTAPASVVTTAQGLMFQSAKGIYLLDRSLSVQYIGAPVEAYNATPITAAALVPQTNQVRLLTASGTALVYHYLAGQWSTFTNHSAVGATVAGGVFSFVRSSGVVCKENATTFADDGGASPIKMRLVTGWLSVAGIQGFQRVRRLFILGDYKGAHRLAVQIATDYAPAFSQYQVIDATTGLPTYGGDSFYGSSPVYGGKWAPYQFRIGVVRQKCEAIRVSIEDAQSTGFNEGYDINALTLEVAVKPGAVRVPASRSM